MLIAPLLEAALCGLGFVAAIQLDTCDMNQIYDFHRASLVSYCYGAATRNQPDEILMGNLKTPLIRQIL